MFLGLRTDLIRTPTTDAERNSSASRAVEPKTPLVHGLYSSCHSIYIRWAYYIIYTGTYVLSTTSVLFGHGPYFYHRLLTLHRDDITTPIDGFNEHHQTTVLPTHYLRNRQPYLHDLPNTFNGTILGITSAFNAHLKTGFNTHYTTNQGRLPSDSRMILVFQNSPLFSRGMYNKPLALKSAVSNTCINQDSSLHNGYWSTAPLYPTIRPVASGWPAESNRLHNQGQVNYSVHRVMQERDATRYRPTKTISATSNHSHPKLALAAAVALAAVNRCDKLPKSAIQFM